ncbi:ribosomal protein L11 methyltransferase [Pedobacter psychrophilus]|uniref:Ribosomal protein L11 methyltransferase n=1 Tax=Pedobacter psychrophilus TaxID=1826909 RepID=A0A179DI98_9SPHI|nr:50S ribosomal protein L11 methyltransferase [Pedobacter psychrophilus]OAQ40741.1 ribosomal protein L11 methyltransferase [Pedobacter psychrophilus]
MNYKELVFTIISDQDYHQDLLIAALGEIGFDTFEETDFGFKAYIGSDKLDEGQITKVLKPFHEQFSFSYEINLIPQKNWNEVWESNFEPIQIKDQVYVRANFHQPKPDFKYEIIIDPKMAFGTGHHQTTAMIMEYLLETDLKDKTVLDMGCGTGILGILSSKLGAKKLVAIDNDDVCYDSTLENSAINNIKNIKALCGSKEAIPDEIYDVILANINRNILVDQMESYAEVLKTDGEIFFSGFYEEPDLDIIETEAAKFDLKYISHKKTDLWVAAKFIK